MMGDGDIKSSLHSTVDLVLAHNGTSANGTFSQVIWENYLVLFAVVARLKRFEVYPNS